MKPFSLLLPLLLLTTFHPTQSATSCLYYLFLSTCSSTNQGTQCHRDYYYNTAYDPSLSSSIPCLRRQYQTSFCLEYATKTEDDMNDTKCYYCEEGKFLYRQEWNAGPPFQVKSECKDPKPEYDEL